MEPEAIVNMGGRMHHWKKLAAIEVLEIGLQMASFLQNLASHSFLVVQLFAALTTVNALTFAVILNVHLRVTVRERLMAGADIVFDLLFAALSIYVTLVELRADITFMWLVATLVSLHTSVRYLKGFMQLRVALIVTKAAAAHAGARAGDRQPVPAAARGGAVRDRCHCPRAAL